MKILTLKDNNLSKITSLTIKYLGEGKLVIAPSDTVYGALVDATNVSAVKKLFQFKNRPPGKPISVFVSDFKMLAEQVEVNDSQLKTLKSLLPGPFTIILNSKHKVVCDLESEKTTLGIRMPAYQFINQLLQKYGKPVTATSANMSGRSAHYSIESLLNELPESKKKLIDLIIDGGKLPHNKPSTIIDLTQSSIKILRQGDILVKNQKAYISRSEEQTRKLGAYLMEKYYRRCADRPLLIIIEGDLGVGKTVLVKGIAEVLGIGDIVSPTYVVYYEYGIKKSKIKDQKSKMIHVDLYNIQDKDEFQYLSLENYLQPGNILCFEWGEKTGEIISELKNKGKIIYVKMKYVKENEREIIIQSQMSKPKTQIRSPR